MNSQLDNIIISEIGLSCADFTVNYALLVKDKFYVAYYDIEHCITVASRPLEGGTWQISRPTGEWLADKKRFMHQTEFDSHNYLTLAMDSDGYIHLSGNMHKDKLVWFRSENKRDIHSLSQKTMLGEREESTTYPLFFYGQRGELFFRYRDGESGNGSDIYNRWNEMEQRWQRLLEQPLLSGMGLMNAYALLPQWGPDNQWHMIWMWRDTPHCETCHDLSYACSPDLINWFTHDGRAIPLPITLHTGDVIDPAPINHGLINMSQNLGFDSQGKVLVTFHRYDEDGHSQAWIARADQQGWQIKKISDWHFRWDFKGIGSIAPEVIISAPKCVDDAIIVSFSLSDGSQGEWWLNPDDLSILRTEYRNIQPLPASYFIPRQQIHASAQVQIIPELYHSQPAHYLRWEALPIQRDMAADFHVPASLLCLITVAGVNNDSA